MPENMQMKKDYLKDPDGARGGGIFAYERDESISIGKTAATSRFPHRQVLALPKRLA